MLRLGPRAPSVGKGSQAVQQNECGVCGRTPQRLAPCGNGGSRAQSGAPYGHEWSPSGCFFQCTKAPKPGKTSRQCRIFDHRPQNCTERRLRWAHLGGARRGLGPRGLAIQRKIMEQSPMSATPSTPSTHQTLCLESCIFGKQTRSPHIHTGSQSATRAVYFKPCRSVPLSTILKGMRHTYHTQTNKPVCCWRNALFVYGQGRNQFHATTNS